MPDMERLILEPPHWLALPPNAVKLLFRPDCSGERFLYKPGASHIARSTKHFHLPFKVLLSWIVEEIAEAFHSELCISNSKPRGANYQTRLEGTAVAGPISHYLD